MMETKLRFALCALLVINLASAEHDNNHTTTATSAPNSEAAPTAQGASSRDPTGQLAPALNGSDTNSSSNGTSNSSSNTATAGETTSLTPEAKTDNDTNNTTPSLAENNTNLMNNLTTQAPVPETRATTSHHILPASIPTSPPDTAHTAPVSTANTTLPTNTSILITKQPAHPTTRSSTSAPTPEPPKTTATVSTQSTSTSSTGSSQKIPAPETQTSPHTSKSNGPLDQTKSTISSPSSPSAQTKVHANTPSQLNVGGDTTMVHESPTLDPLLAGLVSAFIITAVIITLLLFLKLRRRDNRPEFRRLQDLPMDDMMEDTPLSMYTY
ncbi:mucin-5AC-like [Anabas testudineus]|uniref:Uncharacterized protein n=1 Tax=Anabas testudineus TaxID=64144 RepID=A0A3Q1IWC7_ANATE|nr:mucin-5AC-like [Anabas testudineus]